VLSGSKLVDNSKIYHSDANYNFKDLIKVAEIQVGGSYRRYELNSFGRIYTDTPQFGGIQYDEYGVYTQVQKKAMDDRLKFTGSVRYDKAENFDGNYSPRASFVYSAGEAKNHIFRGSFQTGFRNPTTQDQYIGFNVGNAILLGSAPDNLTRYEETLPVTSLLGQALVGGNSTTINGNNAYYNSYTAQSAQAFAALAPTNLVAASALLLRADVDLVKPETVKAFELGYRGEVKGFTYDINGYYNIYNDFIGNLSVLAPLYGKAEDEPDLSRGDADPGVQSVDAIATGNTRAFQLYTNYGTQVSSFGLGLGINYKLRGNFEVSANYNYAEFGRNISISKIKLGDFFDMNGNSLLRKLKSDESGFEAGFNTPRHRFKASISNDKLFKNFGFNISGRWSGEYYWESTFADGMIDAVTVIDAQISYGLPSLKSVIKAGATNLGGREYRQLVGPGLIGQQYFLSLTIKP
jgi:outer membrane cobalamin receptor